MGPGPVILRPERLLRIAALGKLYMGLLAVVTVVSVGVAAVFIAEAGRLSDTWQEYEGAPPARPSCWDWRGAPSATAASFMI